jgi:putative glutamine amidotransferase
MPPRIAIPMPHSTDREYGERAIPQYEHAVALAGGEPVRIPLDQTNAQVKQLIASCAGVLLPGSNADVDPARFNAAPSPHTAAADPRRDAVDDLLLDDAYALGKPVLGICYGLQSLNVHLHGSLIQHIPDFLPEATRGKINHEAGRKVPIAHDVEIDAGSRLAHIWRESRAHKPALSDTECREGESNGPGRPQFGEVYDPTANREGHGFSRAGGAAAGKPALAAAGRELVLSVNSSHHQSADAIGSGLRVVARCPDDGIIEALEGTSPDHFVIAVQWHPERSVEDHAASLAIFRALVEAAQRSNR